MTPPLKRVELWTDVACNTGTRVAVLGIASARATEEITNLLVRRQLICTVPMTDSNAVEIVVRRVLRVTYSDDTYDEYRIVSRVDISHGDGLITVTALGIEYDLNTGTGLVYRVWNTGQDYGFTGQGTPTYLLTTILGQAPSYFSLGTVTPTTAIAQPFAQDTVLGAALTTATLANTAAGGTYELSVRRNGVTNYYLDLTVYGTGATGADLRSGKSLQGIRRTMTGIDMTTRVFPFGSDGGTVGDAWWKVTAVSVNTYIEITDINGSGVNPFLADDQFNGAYLLHEDGVSHEITDTDKANKRLYMASTTGIAVNEWCQLVQDVTLTEYPFIDHPTNQATYGIQVGVLTCDSPSHTNWFKNPDFADGATSWTTTGVSTFVEIYVTGGQSASLASGAFTTVEQSRTVYYTAGQTVTITVWVYVIAYSGTPGSAYGDSAFAGVQFTNPQTAATEDVNLEAGTCSLQTWTAISRTYNITSTGAKTTTIATRRGSTSGATFYVDSAQAAYSTNSVQATASAFVKGSGAATNWLIGAQHLLSNSTPITTYDVSCVDLYRVDPTGAGLYEALNLGATATVVDSELGVSTTARVVKIETNHLVPHDTKVTLSTNRSTLTRLLAAA